jgi:hypothetical protein
MSKWRLRLLRRLDTTESALVRERVLRFAEQPEAITARRHLGWKECGLTADIVLSVTPLWVMSLRMQGEDPDGPPAAARAWLSANTVAFTLSGGHWSGL